jgi:hypothetical protein
MDKQLEQIAGREVRLTVRGHEIVVREVTMKHLKGFAAACSPFLAAFDEAGELAARDDKSHDDFALFKVLAENGEAFMKAAAMVSNAPVGFYEQLRPDEFFEVAAKVVEVNGDFFVRALAPTLIRFAKGVSLIGSMLSDGLSPQGTEADTTSSPMSSVSSTAS